MGALAFIRRDNPLAATSFRQKSERVLLRLNDHPESGRMLPEFPDSLYREVFVPLYRFFYRIKGNDVWVVAVWRDAQMPDCPEEG